MTKTATEATAMLCVEAKHNKVQGYWLAHVWKLSTSTIIQCCILALSSMSPWLLDVWFIQSAYKAILVYAL